jgi:hypothetical protein
MLDCRLAKRIAELLWPLGVGMLVGWVCLYLFLIHELTHGGKIQMWHGVIWLVATFVGVWVVVGSRQSVGGGWKSEGGGQRPVADGRRAVGGIIYQLRISLILTVVGLALPILFSWILGHYTDFSWDGMTSRGITVRNLMNGDPVLNAYPFGHVLAGFLAHITGSWQGGKGINLALIWICFCFVFPTLQALSFSGWRLWMLSAVTTLNPVAVYQISCFQIDGHVASLITCLLFSMLRILVLGPILVDGVLALVAAFVSTAACKTSGVFYAIIIDGIFLLFLAGVSRSLKRVLLLFVVAISVSWPFGVYIRSLGQYAPLNIDYLKRATGAGAGRGFSGGASQLAGIQKMDRIQQFVSSSFSQTEISPSDLHLKIPFEIGRRELRVFEELTPDPRAGGFGPWYGTAFLFASLGCLLLLFGVQATYWPSWFLFLGTAASSFGSQAWWARWTPQNWLLLIAMLMTLLALGLKGEEEDSFKSSKVQRMKGVVIKVLGVLACLATGVNVLLVTLYYFVGMGKCEKILNLQIELAAKLQTPVPLNIPIIQEGHNTGASFQACKWWFVDRGISVAKISQEPSRPRMKINKTETRLPLPPDWKKFLTPKDETLLRTKDLIED